MTSVRRDDRRYVTLDIGRFFSEYINFPPSELAASGVEVHFQQIPSCFRNGLLSKGRKAMMDEKQAFLAAWRNFDLSEEPPDANFLLCCNGSDDESLLRRQLLERLNSCKERLQQAVRVIKREGFILKWLADAYGVRDEKQTQSDLEKVLGILFPSATEQSSRSNQPTRSTATQTGNATEVHSFRDVSSFENATLFDDCDSVERDDINKQVEELANYSEPQPAVGGNECENSLGFENTRGTSGVYCSKLFSRENNEFDEGESLFHDGIIVAEGNIISANDNKEDGTEEDVTSTGVEREPDCVGEKMDEESNNLDSPGQDKPAGHKNRVFTTVLAPLAKGFNKARSKGKWQLPQSPPSSQKHQRSYSHGSSTSEDDVNFSSHAESKTLANLDREDMYYTEADLNDISAINPENMAGVEIGSPETDSSNVVRKCDISNSQTSQRQIEDDNHREKSEIRTEEGRSEKTVRDKNEESPNVIIEGVVDDLILYLERIELESSDEGESPLEGEDIPFGGVIRPRGPLRPRRQLESVLSLGNVSLLSGDSCASPWAIDVAASEMQSADSSEQEDNVSGDLVEIPASTNSSPGLPDTAQEKTPVKQVTPPPVRPPRRSRTERRSRTVGSPKQLKAPVDVGDDEVFGKEGKGYEGDSNMLTRSSEVTRLPPRSDSEPVRPRSQSVDNEEQKKLRKARGSHVVLDESNVDFLSSPVASPQGSPAKQDSGAADTAQKFHRRKWVVAAVLDSEKGYLECLNLLYKHMKPLKLSIESSAPILSLPDYNNISFKLDELYAIHSVFYNDLEARVSHWTDRHLIGDLFLSLVDQFDVYKEYILNYKTALETIRKCKGINEQFNDIFSKELRVNSIQEVTTLEGLFSKPVDRVGRYIVVLNDLIKQTPTDHADFELLTSVLHATQEFLARISGDHRDGPSITRAKRDHRLIKDGFLVELADGVRKFRHLFLFNDYVVCTKRKISARSEQYACKWCIPLSELQFHPSETSEAPQVVPVTSNADFDLLKSRIANTKAEIRREEGVCGHHSPDSSPSSKRRRAQSTNKAVEKLKKRLAEQEAAFLLAIPSLPLTLYHKQGKTYTLLCKSDVERAEWKEAIIELLEQNQGNPSDVGQLGVIELHHLLEACKKLRTCRTLGKVSMKEDSGLLNGVICLQIHSGRGFHKNDLYCVVEIDHYGQFVRKAKTRTCKAASDPVWEQDFDIEVEGTREMKIHVYCKSRLNRDEHCAQGRIELLKENLLALTKQTITITLDKQGAITLSLQYSKTPHGLQRKKSLSEKGVFGVDIATVSRREESDIPLIVIGCVQEIEKRGMDEVGVYRLSGASSDVRKLKDAFDNNSQSALVQVAEADIHAVAGLLKMYLRDLPEPLFTDDLYPRFVEANRIKDPDEKKEKMMGLFESLPTPNRLTSIYLMDHLRRLSEHSEQNKMGLNNLATVFGPNILRPSASSGTDPQDLAQGTLDVMSQVSIFLWFVKFCSLQLPADPELRHRLDPRRVSDVSHSHEFSEHDDRLI